VGPGHSVHSIRFNSRQKSFRLTWPKYLHGVFKANSVTCQHCLESFSGKMVYMVYGIGAYGICYMVDVCGDSLNCHRWKTLTDPARTQLSRLLSGSVECESEVLESQSSTEKSVLLLGNFGFPIWPTTNETVDEWEIHESN